MGKLFARIVEPENENNKCRLIKLKIDQLSNEKKMTYKYKIDDTIISIEVNIHQSVPEFYKNTFGKDRTEKLASYLKLQESTIQNVEIKNALIGLIKKTKKESEK